MKDLFSLKGKTAVVTGGAGYLGASMVEGMLANGASVIAVDILEIKPEEIISNGSVYSELHSLQCDLSSTKSIQEMFAKAKAFNGEIDILVNCGVYGASAPIEQMTDQEWFNGVDGSVGTAFRCIREVIPYFETGGGGVIINIASMYGMVSPDPGIYSNSGQNNPVNYGVAKAGVIQLTKYCAAHLAKKNIRVNCVSPGPFPNPKKLPPEDFMRNLERKTMLGRVGKSEEIAGAVVFLASNAASFMTGTNVVVDGGWTAW